MNIRKQIICLASACLLLGLSACNDDKDGGSAPDAETPPSGTLIGAAGGTVDGPNGSKAMIPPGALSADVMISIEQTSAGSPALHAGFSGLGEMYAFTPHGTTFAVPVTITVPFASEALPPEGTPVLYKTNAQNQWEQILGATFASEAVSAQVTSFSWVQLNGPLLRSEPTRAWEFRSTPGDGGNAIILGGSTQVGGLLEQFVDFGAAAYDATIIGLSQSKPEDGLASGYIFGSPDGVTYGVYAEAPFARLGSSEPIGSTARLEQTQSFIKRAADATLSFTVTGVLISAVDSAPHFSSLPGQTDPWIKGEVYLGVEAYTDTGFFYRAESGVTLTGSHLQWSPKVLTYYAAEDRLFTTDDFVLSVDPNTSESCVGSRATFELLQPRTYRVDLSTIQIGEEFTLRSRTFAATDNRRGDDVPQDCQTTGVNAYLRDPVETGGNSLAYAGLEPTKNLAPIPPVESVTPASCAREPAPDPAAGVLQFSAETYSIGEHAGEAAVVEVMRSDGSVGAVTATFATSDGTAVGDTHYVPVHVTVHFADGDDEPRFIPITILQNQIDAPDKMVNLTLSEPGGCAALGTQSTAVLMIHDDDPAAPGPGGVLDLDFGIDGKVTTVGYGGNDSAMALQADGKIVMVGGAKDMFTLSRYDADGNLDTSFGSNGTVATTTIGLALGANLVVARAVAIQPDGKIVVAGYTQYFSFLDEEQMYFALARYNVDGSLDSSFGSGGIVSVEGPERFRVGVAGRAFAIAIEPDGQLLVAGDLPFARFAVVARYGADGSLDVSFGSFGHLVVPINTTGDGVNLVLQSNGAFVVSTSVRDANETSLQRFLADGTRDASFGINGTVTMIARLGEDLALQPDGKLLLVGSANPGSSDPAADQFAVMRLNADGSPDNTFGVAGVLATQITASGDIAYSIAVQSDAKILAAGSSSLTTNPDFALVRYHPDGNLDLGFATGGKMTIAFDVASSDVAETVLVGADGKILLGGWSQFSVQGYALTRVKP